MFTETSVVMNGPRKYIFALAAAIEDWPIILPHYRSVVLTKRIKQPDGTIHNVATMKAWRLLPFGKIPVGWRTILDSNAETRLLHFVHIGGFTKGMDVYWHLTPEGNGTRVTITHDFTLKWPLIGEFVAHRIVGQFFVDAIARRTLTRITALVEGKAGNLTPQPPLACPEGARDGEGEQPSSRLRSLGNATALPVSHPSPSRAPSGQVRGAGGEGSHRD